MHPVTMAKDVAQRIKTKFIQRKIREKARRIEKLRREVEEEELREAERRAMLIQQRSNVRQIPAWCLQPVQRKAY